MILIIKYRWKLLQLTGAELNVHFYKINLNTYVLKIFKMYFITKYTTSTFI